MSWGNLYNQSFQWISVVFRLQITIVPPLIWTFEIATLFVKIYSIGQINLNTGTNSVHNILQPLQWSEFHQRISHAPNPFSFKWNFFSQSSSFFFLIWVVKSCFFWSPIILWPASKSLNQAVECWCVPQKETTLFVSQCWWVDGFLSTSLAKENCFCW